MEPRWTQQINLSPRMLDPLGLSRVSDWLTAELVPGITTVTNIARNYSFYSWAIYDLHKKSKITRRSQFAQELTRRESAFVMSSILHDSRNSERFNPHGYNRANGVLRNTKGTKIKVAFDVSESNSEGFYGLYYRNAMYQLGLTLQSRFFDYLTPLGKQLALAFEKNIEDTDYFKKCTGKEFTNRKILEKYGKKACVCRLTESTNERDLLRSVFFMDNQAFVNLESSRKETLSMVLSLIQQSSQSDLNFDNYIFRTAVFYGQARNKSKILDYDFSRYAEIRTRWRYFQLHEYMTYALEAILHALLLELKKNDQGLTKDEFISERISLPDVFADSLEISKSKELKTSISYFLQKFKLSELNASTSAQFDKSCNLKSIVSEDVLMDKLDDVIEKNKTDEIVGIALAILLLNHIRTLSQLTKKEPINFWFINRVTNELSPILVSTEIQNKIDGWSTEDLARYYLEKVVEQHNEIAWDKMFNNNDTFRFQDTGTRLKFKMDIRPNYPAERSSKISSMIDILSQMGLIVYKKNIYHITKDAEKILKVDP